MIRVFISYSHADEELRQVLDKHLMSLRHQGLIEVWHDRRIGAGEEWAGQIDENIRNAHIILILISADFIASRYCYEIELAHAMERHGRGEAVVIPVILRPCDWHDLAFGKMQAATRDGRPVVKFPTLDDGFLEVVNSLKLAARKFASAPNLQAKGLADRKFLEAMEDISPGAVTHAPRSGNLGVKKKFSDHDKDSFRIDSFEYIAAYFENSLRELEGRNPHLKSRFRRRDANSFEAHIYENGTQKAACGIWIGGNQFVGEIAYSSGGLGSGNSFNESLSVVDDGNALGLKPLGLAIYGARDSRPLTMEGAAEFYWSTFIRPLQN